MSSYFSEHYSDVSYPIDSVIERGLRNAQLGAVHAISSYFTLNHKHAAIIVMPTGTGKTAVLMMIPYLLRKNKILVISPSRMVRGQITDDFMNLTTLCKAQVFPETMQKPNVFEMEHQYSVEMDNDLQAADVIVATPNCALSLSETDWAKNSIDLVEVDEAHHSPAKTWMQVLINLEKAAHVLFTATPFRLDRKEIIGDIVFDYPLSQAYSDGIYGEIQYVSVDVEEDYDKSIAKKAEEIYLNDKATGFIHYLMVRTDTKEKAMKLESLYAENTHLRLRRIDSSVSHTAVKKCLEQLKLGELDGIICVDMLGEGYDFPNLKIAAIHAPHKSLASTLQFIGRFARTNASNIGTAKFLAVDDTELEIENKKLYSKDAVWQDMIIGLSENKNQSEVANRHYYRDYESDEQDAIINVPIQAIRPNCHDRIYRIREFHFSAVFPDSCNVASRVRRSKSDNTIVGIGLDHTSPLWMGNGEKLDSSYILYIVHYQQETNMLHIYSPKHTEIVYEEIAAAFSDGYELIPKSEIYRVLGDLQGFEIFNSGMLNRQAESGESYRILAGSDVSNAIDPSTGRLYSAGHAFCKARDSRSGDEITIGYSSASKIWSSSYLDLKDYILWCDSMGQKIANQTITVKTNTNFDLLPKAEKLYEYPTNIFYGTFSDKTYTSPPLVIEEKDKLTLLTDCSIIIREQNPNYILIEIMMKHRSALLKCDTNGHYYDVKETFMVRCGFGAMTLSSYLSDHPIFFRTLDDMAIQGIDIYPGEFDIPPFDKKTIVGVDWEALKVDTSIESSSVKMSGKVSIQDGLESLLVKDPSNKYIVYDHGSGEIADYIAFQESGNEIRVILYHVKKMSAKTFNSSVDDIYEVCGQAAKSVMWFLPRGKLPDRMVQRKKNRTKFMVKGDFDKLIQLIRNTNMILRGTIIIVQPSISESVKLPDKLSEVLGATSNFITRAGKVNQFMVWGSK